MKAIISHDIDTLTVYEHYKDLIIPKHIVRSLVETFNGGITLKEAGYRILEIIENKTNYIKDIVDFNKKMIIPTTFFIGVNNGLGLSYSLSQAEKWIEFLENKGCNLGVHSLQFDDLNKIADEYKKFQSLSKIKRFGVRIHYLRMTKETLEFFNKAGFSYDSSLYTLKDPFKVGNLYEFPLHIMDTRVLNRDNNWRSLTFKEAQDYTISIINHVREKKLKYLTILFHDRYYSPGFQKWKDWYQWLIEYIKNEKIEFIDYFTAIEELKNNGL